ncbi:MAG: hypothetical protein JOZ15_02755 [Acidobacteria bacterium]|nr:hypothetical protein [Acidobacteriota bacterium]
MGLELRIWLLSVTALAAAGAPAGAVAPAPEAPSQASTASPTASPNAAPSAAPAVPDMPGMPGMPEMSAPGTPGAASGEAAQGATDTHGAHDMNDLQGMQGMHAMHGMHAMRGLLGPYGMSREASGTSWQPQSSPHEALFTQRGPWALMLHGQAFLIYDDQEGKRGGSKWFSENHLAGIAARQLGPGRLGLRAMLSLEPWTIGRNGYPLLLQTGETANGRTELVDRQHPHDLFDELAATYSLPLWRDSSIFLYAGLPGEPALGPPAYLHRFSAIDNPETPLSHHWLDSTHVSYGVATLGLIMGDLKLEGSSFRGREPDQHRADLESPKLDSYSVRFSFQPDPGLSVQGSFGHLKSPEQLAPNVDVHRSTVSVIYNTPLAESGNLQATFAWGRNKRLPGRTTDAYLFEATAFFLARHTLFFRFEELENDELVADVLGGDELVLRNRHLVQPVAAITKVAGGYVYDFLVGQSYRTGAGFDLSVVHVPTRLEPSYGSDWVPGWMLFLRFRLGSAAM